MKCSSGDNKYGSVNKKRNKKRRSTVNSGKTDGFFFSFRSSVVVSGLHNTAVKIQVVRHDCCSQNPDRNIKHGRIGNNFFLRNQTVKNGENFRFRNNKFISKTQNNNENKSGDNTFNPPESFGLKHQDKKYIYNRNDDAPRKGNSEK